MQPSTTPKASIRDRTSPRRSFIATAILTLVTLAALVGNLVDTQRVIREMRTTSLRIERVCGDITYLDEVLTMSARLCASTGDLSWKERYDKYVPRLNDAIAASQRLASLVTGSDQSQKTSAASERLFELEDLAFELVEADRQGQALQVLSSEEYQFNKQLYSAGTNGFLSALRTHIELVRARLANRQSMTMVGTSLALAALMALWLRVGRSLTRHERMRDDYDVRLARYATELEQTNLEVAEARDAAEQASRAKGEFVATVSHELRTPMNGVIGCARLLADSELSEEQREYVEAIQLSGNSLLALINDVLDFSKIEAGKMNLDLTPGSAHELLERLHAMMGQTARIKGLDLTYSVHGDVPGLVLIDSLRMSQILTNLVGNAIKFTEEGNVSIELSSRALGLDRVELAFVVRDSGIGVEPGKLPNLFLDFEQAEDSTSRRYGGTGLGLAISNRLTQLMGGELSVESRVGVGSEFTVRVPVQVAEVPSPLPKRERTPESRVQARVLLVEDNLINQMVANRMLVKLGCEVVLAANGEECLERLAERPFDLVFMDCQMPVMDGFEASRAIRSGHSANRDVPIVALTANAEARDRELCLEAGMSDYLAKPVQVEELLHALELHLQRPARDAQAS